MFYVVVAFMLVFGPVNLVVGMTRFRDPSWRTTGWWKDHKLLGLTITGLPLLGPRRLRN